MFFNNFQNNDIDPNDIDFISKYIEKNCSIGNNTRVNDDKFQMPDSYVHDLKISDYSILYQEFSRKCLNWPTIKIGSLKQDGEKYKFENTIFDFLVSKFPSFLF